MRCGSGAFRRFRGLGGEACGFPYNRADNQIECL
nr:MAG TPA: hypothetical protein [Caudoviricetes sp.]